MKKIICAVCIAAMLICPIAVFAVAGNEFDAASLFGGGPEAELAVVGEKAYAGKTAEIAVSLDAPATSVIGIYLSDYDAGLLKWTGGAWEELDGILLANVQLADKTASCALSPASDVSSKVFTMTFEVSKDAKPQTTEIGVTLIVKSNDERTTIETSVELEIACSHTFENGVCTNCGENDPATSFMLGDVNGDGDITNVDVLHIFKYLFNSKAYPLDNPAAADVNLDGEISNKDVLRIFQYIFNPERYPITK